MNDYLDRCVCGHYRYQHHNGQAGPDGPLSEWDASLGSGDVSMCQPSSWDWSGGSDWSAEPSRAVSSMSGDTACGLCSCSQHDLE